MSTEILRNIPHIVYFATADTPASAVVTYIHTDATVAVSAIVQHGSTDHYQVHFTPTTCGPWIISIYNAGGDVLHSESFECVDATKSQHAMKLQPPYHGLVDVWPTNIWNSSGTRNTFLCQTGTARTYCGMGKHVVPYDGFIYGIKWVGHTELADFDSAQFVTMYSESTDKLTLRSISEDIHAKTPTDGAYDNTNFRTIYFDKPVYAERGDSFGFYGLQTSGSAKAMGYFQDCKTDSQTAQEMRYINGVLGLTGENTTLRYGADPGQRRMALCKLIMEPPSVVIAGHSFWSGGVTADTYKSSTVFEDSIWPFHRLGDPGSLLADILGAPCCNCSDSGTNITNWVGTSGLFATNIAPLRPAVVIYDTVYNDKSTAYFGGDPTEYPIYLGHLLAHCDQIGAQLILMESPPSRYATDDGVADKLELFNAVAMLWSQHNGVPYVALHHRLGQHSGGDEHDSLRRHQKHDLDGIPNYYYYSGDAYIHPTTAALRAAMLANAEAVRFRVPQPRITAPTTTYDEVVPENTVSKTGSADTVTTDSASRLAITDHGDTNWGTATGFATPTNVTDAVTAIESHGDTNWGTADVSALATSDALDAVDAKIDDVLEDTGTTLPAAITGVWVADERTLTSSASTVGPTAGTTVSDIFVTVYDSQTARLDARIRNWDGDDILQADITSITYTISLLDAYNPDTRTAVDGHTAVTLNKASVIYDTLQSDSWASDYNFSFIPDISTKQAFALSGRQYVVDVNVTPTIGQRLPGPRFVVTVK